MVHDYDDYDDDDDNSGADAVDNATVSADQTVKKVFKIVHC